MIVETHTAKQSSRQATNRPVTSAPSAESALEIRHLKVCFAGRKGSVPAVRDVSISVRPGETLGIVGESGSGKSVTFLAALGLLPPPPTCSVEGTISINGKIISAATSSELRKIRGRVASMIFQDPMTALNPYLTIETQIGECLTAHGVRSRSEIRRRVLEALFNVEIPDPESRLSCYPHELSGGMRQRIVIAMATIHEPDVIIADEPTTALDVTIQAQILDLLRRVQKKRDSALILISHNLGVVAGMADRVAVMYAGQIVEENSTDEIFRRPRHPYTRGLLRAVPSLTGSGGVLPSIRGLPPDLSRLPGGCSFAPRCPDATAECSDPKTDVPWIGVGAQAGARCLKCEATTPH